ncbi:MAG: acylneuraminate cytidylyltransferase family protein [Bacteroidetes bacterium]|nr:MAG: acylneuraminate cytidylyltransferase family protein [Bacteroidota bacterium]
MKNNKTVLGLITARGGSKGIPWKNIVDLGDKPLIAWTIEASLKSKFIDKTIVSTDSEEIANIAKRYSADVPFLRPHELALDESSSYDAIFHALDWLNEIEKKEFDIICLLQPTSPFRNQIHIDEAIDKFAKNNDSQSLISICVVDKNPYWMVAINEKGYLEHLKGLNTEANRRQDLMKVYQFNGAIYIMGTSAIRKYKQFMTEKTIYYLMDRESSVDIDEQLDLEFARFLLEKKRNKK